MSALDDTLLRRAEKRASRLEHELIQRKVQIVELLGLLERLAVDEPMRYDDYSSTCFACFEEPTSYAVTHSKDCAWVAARRRLDLPLGTYEDDYPHMVDGEWAPDDGPAFGGEITDLTVAYGTRVAEENLNRNVYSWTEDGVTRWAYHWPYPADGHVRIAVYQKMTRAHAGHRLLVMHQRRQNGAT